MKHIFITVIYVSNSVAKTKLNPLMEIYLQCHEYVRAVKKQESGRYPGKYKRFEKVKINKYFDTISYKAINNLDFASETMSNLIVIHGLPNANHRSTIVFIGVVLRALDIAFPNYDVKKYKKRWVGECNRYIRKSKRILNSTMSYPPTNLIFYGKLSTRPMPIPAR